MIYGIHAVKAGIKNAGKDAHLKIERQKSKSPQIAKLVALAQSRKIKISFVAGLDRPDLNHQGVILENKPAAHSGGEHELFALLAKKNRPLLLLILDGVTDPRNLGACLRSADAASADAVIVPKDRSCPITPAAAKTASGAAESVNFFRVTNLARVLKKLADRGVWLVGLDDKSQQSFYAEDLTGDTALVLGFEGSGLRRLTKENCQTLASLPVTGEVSSLNVAVCAGIGLFEAVRQRR